MTKILRFAELGEHWPKFPAEADKYARGVVGVMTGSQKYPGAAVLSVLGALNSGAGFVRYCGDDAACSAVLTRAPSVTFGMGKVDAWVVGCGWDEDDDEGNSQKWKQIMESGAPTVVDAGALGMAAQECPPGSLLTPHAGELARLTGVNRAEVEADPINHVQEAAKRFSTAVLLKGRDQYVASSTGRVTQLQQGSSWLARAGSGDVLAGIAGTLLAQTADPETTGFLAAGIQAYVSAKHIGPWPPDRMAEFLPQHIGIMTRGHYP